MTPSNFHSQRTSCTWWITLCWTFLNQFASRKTKHGSGPYAQHSMSEIQYGYNCGDRQVSISATRKHFSRMRSDRLPTVRVIVATTRCRYWGEVCQVPSRAGGRADIHTHPFPCTYPPPLDIPPVHTTLPKIYPLDIPSPIQKGPGTRHTYPHPRRDLEPRISTHPHLLNPTTTTTPISPPPLPPGEQNDCQMRVKILPFRNYCWAHLSLKYSQWTLAHLTVI